MNDVTILLLGATGDLSRRKLLPAIFRLIKQKKLINFVLLGAAIDKTDARTILEQSREFMGPIDEAVLQTLQDCFFYETVDFNKPEDFNRLNVRATELEKKFGLPGNRMAYLATAAEFFCAITEYLATSKLIIKSSLDQRPWQRIVYEKPFGHDLASAHEINECIEQHFEEHQIYRIDHFLTKELVSNIALLRFTNCVFEPLWNNRYIDQVQITISEKLGLEGRGGYYDKYGALSDVMQNHMLELVALIGMESPEKLTGEYVRDRRVEVLKKIEIVDGMLGQFDQYKNEKNVQKNSTTETFAALMLRINNPRWAGVPFYVKTGKCLEKKETIIHIKFKQVDCLLTHSCPVPSNWMTMEVSPDSMFALTLNVKKPGRSEQVQPVAMEFCHSCIFGAITPHAYEVIFEEVMRGEQSIAVRFDEIECAWKIIDEVRTKQFPLYSYECGTNGPQELTEFEQKHGMRWRS